MKTIRQLVCLGGDTDTIASMFGQLSGTAHGAEVLPTATASRIDAVDLVRETAIELSHTTV